MTNDELFARQMHNVNQAIFGLAIVINNHLRSQSTPTADGSPSAEVVELDRVMQLFADTHQRLTTIVQEANARPGIILPH
jgi:hypothetical protein